MIESQSALSYTFRRNTPKRTIDDRGSNVGEKRNKISSNSYVKKDDDDLGFSWRDIYS